MNMMRLKQDTVTLAMVGEALAAFEATLHRTTSFDRFMRGDHDRLSDQQILGLHLFRTTARCANCHMGPRLTDDEFHNIGLTYYGRQYEDLGRYTVTGDPADVGRTVAWLVSDAADYITGQTLFVDGGMTLYPGFRGNG